eukprot:scaffold19235_cov126-Isochrysis_galbana.AAC.20
MALGRAWEDLRRSNSRPRRWRGGGRRCLGRPRPGYRSTTPLSAPSSPAARRAHAPPTAQNRKRK